MTAGERGRSIAPTCQNVPLEFKCILFNRWSSERALQPFEALSLFPSRNLLIVAPFSSCSTISLPSSYWEYSLITCASLWRTVFHDSTLLRRSLFSQFKCWTRRLFRMRIKSVQEAKPCFQVRPAGKETAGYSRSTSIGPSCQNTSVRTLTLLRVSRRMIYSINHW